MVRGAGVTGTARLLREEVLKYRARVHHTVATTTAQGESVEKGLSVRAPVPVPPERDR